MSTHPHFGVILPAAGTGTRFGQGDKLLVDLNGQTVLQRSVGLFARRSDVSRIMIVTAPERFDDYRAHLATLASADRLVFVPGGRERWESVLLGLRALAASQPTPKYVAIHDAARPLTPASVVQEAFAAAVAHGGAVPCLAEPATLKRRAPDGRVSETVDRRSLFQAQTPQCFQLAPLLDAYESLLSANRLADVTDDAQVFERASLPVMISPGSALNLKITTAEDAALARAILSASSI